MLRVDAARQSFRGERGQRVVARDDLATKLRLPTCISLTFELIETFVFDQYCGALDSEREVVDCTHMAIEQIFRIDALPPYFRIEVHAARGKPAMLENLVEGQREFFNTIWELVRIPAVLWITPIRVDAAENAQRISGGNFVMEGVSSKCRVIGFDVYPNVLLESVLQ